MTDTSLSVCANELTTLARQLDILESQSIGKDATEDWSALMYIAERISLLEYALAMPYPCVPPTTDGLPIIQQSLEDGARDTNSLT